MHSLSTGRLWVRCSAQTASYLRDIDSTSRGECLCPKTGATHNHARSGLPDKGPVIKRLVVHNNLDLEPLDMLNGLASGYNQPSPEVFIVFWYRDVEERKSRRLASTNIIISLFWFYFPNFILLQLRVKLLKTIGEANKYSYPESFFCI